MSYARGKQLVGPGSGPRLVRPVGTGLRGPAAGGLRKSPGAPGPQPGHPGGPRKSLGPAKPVQGHPPPGGGAGGGPAAVKQPPQPQAQPPPPQEMEVGDRVLVGGVKPGTVSFLGTTQFARGVWAGVVLDTKDGKNNGCVNGVQYFVCEPNQGLFARPEKLTLLPKPQKPTAAGQPRPAQGKAPPPSVEGAPPTFSIGDKVLVEGGKEGVIGFYGNTEFARGVWVGVVLDSPEGKNNGTVAGVQYFQCSPNHGLFTRPQKLQLISKDSTRPQLAAAPSRQPGPVVVNTRPVGVVGDRSSEERELCGSSQQRSSQVTPGSDLRALREKLKLGDRVLVGGAKEGFLRYLGPTEFAKGIWAGVELEDALGKNDGAVSGKRYFQCPPQHGLFAPLPKVEKLADSGPPPPEEVHSSTQSSPRQHSRHLSNSSSGSIGSGKPHAVMTPSSSLRGSTATDLSRILQEKESLISSLQTSLLTKEREGKEMVEKNTELSRQVEDLQFQLEEQGIISGDNLVNVEEGTGARVSELESELREEREARSRLQAQLERSEVTSTRDRVAQQEVEALSRQLEEKEEEMSLVKKTLDSTRATTADMQRQVKSGENLVQQLMADKSRLEEQLLQLSQLSGDSSEQLSFLQHQLQEKERLMEDLYSRQEKEREEAEKAKDDFRIALERFQSESQHHTVDLNQQLDKANKRIDELTTGLRESHGAMEGERVKGSGLEGELSEAVRTVDELRAEATAVKQDLQVALELCGEHEALIEERNKELATSDAEIRSLKKDCELLQDEKTHLVSEQQRLTQERDRSMLECDQLMTQSASTTTEQSEMSQQRQQLMTERDQLVAERQAQRTEIEKVSLERDELVRSFQELKQQQQNSFGESQDMIIKYDSMQEELTEAKDEAERLRLEMMKNDSHWEQEKLVLQEQLEMTRSSSMGQHDRIEQMVTERDTALNKAQEMADQLTEAEGEREGLQELVASGNCEIERLQDELVDLRSSHQALEREVMSESSGLQLQVENLEASLEERERELAEARESVASLEDELVISQGKRDLGMLEEEKELLEERVKELTLQLEQANAKKPAPTLEGLEGSDAGVLAEQLGEAQSQMNEMQESIQDYDQQVNFLNSVISDLQGKLEAAESLALLPGELSYGDDDLEILPPPRLFCDICDQFDLHDTDDCPQQASASDSPPPSMFHGARAPGGSDRPYCNNCEIFGHWTDECEYDVTY